MQQTKSIGTYEFVVMLAATTFGFLGGPPWIAPATGLLLTLSTFREYVGLQQRLARAGGTRLIAGAMLMTALTSLLFAALCFGMGRALAWIIFSA
jgi:hypothetical protein